MPVGNSTRIISIIKEMRNKQSIFLKNFAKLILWAFDNGFEVTAGELHRTDEQHALNVAKGISKAKRSKHQDRLAGDLNLFINGIYKTDQPSYKPLGEYWVSLHPQNRWGGDFNKDGNKTTNDG
jgi:hypothetical protein